MFVWVSIASRQINYLHLSPLSYTESELFYEITTADGSIYARIKKRTAYPRTYCSQLSPHTVRFGYGQPESTNGEYLTITLDACGRLVIERDAFATLPVFYGKTEDVFVATNTYEAVVSAMPTPSICHSQLLNVLANRNTDAYNKTLLQEVRILTEGETLRYSREGMSVLLPPNRGWGKTTEAAVTAPKDFQRVFDERLADFVATRLTGEQFAFETSGGLDSSILPLYMHQRGQCPQRVPTTAVLVDGFGDSQQRKIELLRQTIGGTLFTTPLQLQSDYPFKTILDAPQPFYNYQGLYESAFERLAETLHEQGVRVVCRGFGGDDIFEHCASPEKELGYGKSEQGARQECDLPPFLTSSFRQAYVAATPEKLDCAIPFRPLSLVKTAACVNNTFIKHDIWPVTPYAHPALYAYCQGLPVQFRYNKRILRAYCQAYRFPSLIYAGPNEHFGNFFQACWQTGVYDRIFTYLLQNAATVRYGYVDADSLRTTYQDVVTGTRHSKWLFALYCWLAAEINLQHTSHLRWV